MDGGLTLTLTHTHSLSLCLSVSDKTGGGVWVRFDGINQVGLDVIHFDISSFFFERKEKKIACSAVIGLDC